MYSNGLVTGSNSALHSNLPNSTILTLCHWVRQPALHVKIRNPNMKSPTFLSISTQPPPPKSYGKPRNGETWSAGDEFDLHWPVVADSLKLLEWPKVCESVAAFSGTPLGKEALKKQLSSLNLSHEQSETLLSETAAGIEFLKFSSDSMDFSRIRTVEAKSAIDRASRGFVMDGNEALAIAILLQFCNELQSTLKIAIKEDAEWHIRFMPLTNMINDMVINQALIRIVSQAIDEEGSVKDDASSELKRARNQVCILEQRLYEVITNVLRGGSNQNSSQEVSYVDGRWCIRAGVDQLNDFQGILLWSGSGVETYIEPVTAVPLNDELAQARALVAKAEHEVLTNLTKKILPHLGDIQLLLDLVIQLDVVTSRAKYSLAFEGTRPTLSFIETNGFSSSEQLVAENQDGAAEKSSGNFHGGDWLLHLQKAYHPLLLQQHRANLQEAKQKVIATASQLRRARTQGERFSSRERLEKLLQALENKVAALEAAYPIPIDVLIRRKTKVLIITGPNTGGKTATIKTVGLAALMAKSGLYVLAAEGVRMPCFDSVFADIGDEQSLSQSLSTFSGHLQQIKSIQVRSTGRSLVLLDEVGAGTNPLEGAALGMSLLESFADSSSVLTIATTHQGELKMLKYSDDRFENACVEFDEENLRPTYKLLWGIPGRSNAISIAKRLGLPIHIIDNARQLYGTTSAEINKVIIDLERTKQDFQRDIQDAGCYLMKSRTLYERLMEVNKQILEYSALQQYRKSQAIFEAAANARSALYNTMRIFRESQGKVSITKNETTNVSPPSKASMDHMSGKTNDVPYIGQMVYVPSLGEEAKVLEVNENKNEIFVQSGNLKLKLRWSEWSSN